jgi:hypothetical protein
MFLVNFDLKFGRYGEFGLTKTYFSKNIFKKIKFFDFFRKKIITQKNEFAVFRYLFLF